MPALIAGMAISVAVREHRSSATIGACEYPISKLRISSIDGRGRLVSGYPRIERTRMRSVSSICMRCSYGPFRLCSRLFTLPKTIFQHPDVWQNMPALRFVKRADDGIDVLHKQRTIHRPR
jgi:hypothetical protein